MNSSISPTYDVMIARPMGLDTYGLHKAIYTRFAPLGHQRTFLFSEVSLGAGKTGVMVRGDFTGITLPDGMARQIAKPEVGTKMSFILRANPTVKSQVTNKPEQIGLSTEKDPIRLRWLGRRGADHGFEVVEASVTAEPLLINGKSKPFAINVANFSGVLRVTDADKLHAAIKGGIGKAQTWGCGLLILNPLH